MKRNLVMTVLLVSNSVFLLGVVMVWNQCMPYYCDNFDGLVYIQVSHESFPGVLIIPLLLFGLAAWNMIAVSLVWYVDRKNSGG